MMRTRSQHNLLPLCPRKWMQHPRSRTRAARRAERSGPVERWWASLWSISRVSLLQGAAVAVGARSAGRVKEDRRPAHVLCVGRAGAERNAAGRRAQAFGAGSASGGPRPQDACRRPDGRLKIVDRATRDVHSVAWTLRRAVGCAGVQSATQQGGVPKRRCRQPGGHGGQEHAEARRPAEPCDEGRG